MMIDLTELRDAAQKAFPADRLSPDRDASWRLITEMGWPMIELSEQQGGLGLGRAASATLHYEMGRMLSSAPFAPALLGLQAIAASTTLTDQTGWIERLCGGEYVPLHMLPSQIAGGDRLSGRIGGVFEADMASHIVAALPDRYALIPLDAPGVNIEKRATWDESRQLFDVILDDYALPTKNMLATGEAATAMHGLLALSAHIALAADALGGANAMLERTIEYLNMRRQYDRPIAMFQALKHRVADMKVKLVAAEALFWSRISNPATTPSEMGALKAHCTSVYASVVEDAIQLHGGIGLTQEHPCHLFFKRAFLNRMLCGDADYHEEKAGRALMEIQQ